MQWIKVHLPNELLPALFSGWNIYLYLVPVPKKQMYGKSVDAVLRIANANEFPLVSEGDFGNHLFYGPAMGTQPSSDNETDAEIKDDPDFVAILVKDGSTGITWARMPHLRMGWTNGARFWS